MDSPKIGDLLFFRPSTEGKSANTVAQFALRGRRAYFSHVAIAVGKHYAIHAMPNEGVHVAPISTFSSGPTFERLKVIRHEAISKRSDCQIALHESLFYYLGQPYNKKFWFRQTETASYCSELAAKAYRDLGFPLSKLDPKHVLPVDLQQLTTPDWKDVTHVYMPNYSETVDPFVRAIDAILGIDDSEEMATEKLIIDVQLRAFSAEVNQLKASNLINVIHEILSLPKVTHRFGRSTWLEHLLRKKNDRE